MTVRPLVQLDREAKVPGKVIFSIGILFQVITKVILCVILVLLFLTEPTCHFLEITSLIQ